MAVTSIANKTRRTVGINPVAAAAIGDVDHVRAFINGAIATLKCSDDWDTTAEDIETVYLLEAAVERIDKLRDDLDRALIGRTEAHHG